MNPSLMLIYLKNKPYMKSCDTRKARPEEKILSPEEIDSIKEEVRHRMSLKKWGSYYINGYAVLFAIETGVRVGELCALKWSDITENSIHIHAKQLDTKENGKKVYYYDTCTKNEKGISEDGYLTFLRRLCQSKGFSVTNNHALRMSLNSNVLLPMGISVADRAAMLGHSIQTNLQYYSFAQKDYLDNVRQLLDSMGESPEGTPENRSIFQKKKAQKT